MNPNDWQNQITINNSSDIDPLIKLYYEQLSLYETTNINFHSGNLLEHSIWSLLWSEYILNQDGKFEGLMIPDVIKKNNDLKRVIAFSAFIHDIGKMAYILDTSIIYNSLRKKFIYYDVKEHMIYGANFIKNGIFPVYDDNAKLVKDVKIDELFSKFGIDLKYKQLIAIIITFHWDFGNILKKLNENILIMKTLDKYLNDIYNMINPTNVDSFVVCVSSVLIVSMSDILATQPYGINRITNKKINTISSLSVNKESDYFPFIKNIPKNYKGINLPVIANLYTQGIKLSNKLFVYSTTFYNKKMEVKKMEVEEEIAVEKMEVEEAVEKMEVD